MTLVQTAFRLRNIVAGSRLEPYVRTPEQENETAVFTANIMCMGVDRFIDRGQTTRS
jgi:hypothetical protein